MTVNPPYIQHLEDLEPSDISSWKKALKFGVTRLPLDPHRDGGDYELAKYFFALSELDVPTVDIRDFLLDAMSYCEEVPRESLTHAKLQTRFHESILPQLEDD